MTFPARFQLLAAMNPCPCGFAGAQEPPCTCPSSVPDRYQKRISGPLRDRIDLAITMPRVAPAALVAPDGSEGSAVVAARIERARAVAWARQGGSNGRLRGQTLRSVVSLTTATRRHVQALAELERASGRGVERLLRVARTIADLAETEPVTIEHLDEAAWFRSPESRAMTARAV